MSRKSNYTKEQKLETIRRITSGECSIPSESRRLKCNQSTIKQWLNLYNHYGEDRLIPKSKNKNYSQKLKEKVIEEILLQKSSIRQVCQKYEISSHSIVSRWVREYNYGKDVKSKGQPMYLAISYSSDFTLSLNDIDWRDKEIMGITKMLFNSQTGIIETDHRYSLPEGTPYYKVKGRKTSYSERFIMALCCVLCGHNYAEIVSKCGVSYQQIYNWTKALESGKTNSLSDDRGKRKEPTREEALEAENLVLKAKCYYLERLTEHLKK